MRREVVVLETQKGRFEFQVEVAETMEQKEIGLMFRKSLAADAGMIFFYVPPQEVHMWMQNTFVSLDMVFIAADGRVERIAEHTEPLSQKVIASKGPVLAVLELNAGTAARIGLAVGDRVRHQLIPDPGTSP